MLQVRAYPAYRLAFCPRLEMERARTLPADVRDRFSAEELADIEALPEHRRRDRLAGRLAAKRALARHFSEEDGWEPEPRELELFNNEDGRPLLRLPREAPTNAPAFSIAHCVEGAAAAVAAAGGCVGVDVESVVLHPREVLAFVSTPAELSQVPSSDPMAQTRLWTGKEAALKLLGLGLDADARCVRVDEEAVTWSGRPAEAWRALGAPRVRLAFERVGDAMIAVAHTGG